MQTIQRRTKLNKRTSIINNTHYTYMKDKRPQNMNCVVSTLLLPLIN